MAVNVLGFAVCIPGFVKVRPIVLMALWDTFQCGERFNELDGQRGGIDTLAGLGPGRNPAGDW